MRSNCSDRSPSVTLSMKGNSLASTQSSHESLPPEKVSGSSTVTPSTSNGSNGSLHGASEKKKDDSRASPSNTKCEKELLEGQEVSFLSSVSESNPSCKYVASTRNTRCKGDDEFNQAFLHAQEAIMQGVLPDLIAEGSSGSYFVKDEAGTYVAVFKPKDEEPFAALNPKWPKFFQRVLCFCCFGRACLIPNSGYLSETGASIVDAMLNLHVVPKTRVVKLASSSFFYARCCGRVDVKPKEGSFQLFVHGYDSAHRVFARWEYDKTLLSPEEDKKFTGMFQKMCVLDYIIRNTDRHMDNLLIRHIPGKELKIAAIDNGLAFPVKHPESASRFRTFPFRWAEFRWAEKPIDEELKIHLLLTLTPRFAHDLCLELKSLFRHANASSRVLVTNQLRVVRGQLWNLREALLHNMTLAELSKMKPVLLSRRYRRKCPKSSDWMEWFKMKNIDYTGRSCC